MLGKLDSCVQKRSTLDHFLIPYTKIYSKCIKDLTVWAETIKTEENITNKLFEISLSSIFLDMLHQVRKTKMNKWNCIKLKSFHSARETVNKTKKIHLLNGIRYLQMIDMMRNQYPKYKKNSSNTTSKTLNNPIENEQRTCSNFIVFIWYRHFPKKIYAWSPDIWKDIQHYWSSGKRKSKPPWNIVSHLSEWLLSKHSK